MGIFWEDLREFVIKYGDDIKMIRDDSDAGNICECCVQEECDQVDILLADAIKEMVQELANNN